MKRRQFLGLSVMAGLGGCSLGSSVVDRFETVVNIGATRAVRRGERSIVPLIEEHADDDTALYFPRGTYLMDDTVEILEFTNLGIIGEGATIVPPDGYDSLLFDIGRPGMATDFHLQDIEFDMRSPETGARVLSVLSGGEVTIRDLSVIGKRDAGTSGVMRLDVTEPDGVATVERLHLPHGSTKGTSASGCFVGEYHRGEARFIDCHIKGFADNGLYASRDRGSIYVEGGVFANNDIANLRVGDNSVVRGAYVRCDATPDGFGNMRGLRVRQGSNVLIEDCTIDMFRASFSGGALVLARWLESATIRNTRIRVDTDDTSAIRIRSPDPGVSRDGAIRIQNVRITGTAANESAIEVDGRDNCRFDRVHLRQTGANRDGFLLDDCQDVVVRNSFIDVTGSPIITQDGSTVSQVNVVTPFPLNSSYFPRDSRLNHQPDS